MVALWDEVSRLDDDFGLHLGEATVSAPFALPWHLVRASTTLGEGIPRLLAAWRVFNEVHPPDLVFPDRDKHRTEGVLRIRTKDTPFPVPRHAIEYAFAWFVVAARRATGTEVAPVRVTFEHPAPLDTTEHARIFGCKVDFDDDASTMVFSGGTLGLPTVQADPDLVHSSSITQRRSWRSCLHAGNSRRRCAKPRRRSSPAGTTRAPPPRDRPWSALEVGLAGSTQALAKRAKLRDRSNLAGT
jgi:hypothetical protein